MYVCVMAFFAKISDPTIGGTYMTLLNTVSNLGKRHSDRRQVMNMYRSLSLHQRIFSRFVRVVDAYDHYLLFSLFARHGVAVDACALARRHADVARMRGCRKRLSLSSRGVFLCFFFEITLFTIMLVIETLKKK